MQRDVSKNGTRDGLTFYSYDANGNQILEQTMVSPPTITETIQKEYDTNNQLTKVTGREGNASGTIKYTQVNTYNYEGQRISKTDNGVTTHYYYQGGVLLYTTDGAGNKTSQNVVGPQDNVIATIHYGNVGQHSYFYNKDIRTSVTNVINESGSGVVSYQYDDYGTTTKYGNEDFYNEVCYTSGMYDELTGLYYLNARYYNPDTATFITQDSYRGEQTDYGTWNLYAYCGGNPVNYVDPSGHDALVVPLYEYGAANAWNPTGWIAIATASVIIVGDIIYLGGKAYEAYKVRRISRTRVKVRVKAKAVPKVKINSAVRSKHRIARRRVYNSRKGAYEAAKKAGKGREPIHHRNHGEKPHYHPNVKNPYSKTPKQPNFHAHYYYPR